jgi:fumarate reductase flavoprotein subunit
MMGGLVFSADCTTPMPNLFAAGEDTGGVHGANRLGGNGVANSTVFGGLAGDSMAAKTNRTCAQADPERAALDASLTRAFAPFRTRRGDVESLRQALMDTMWNDVGIIRSTEGLARGAARLNELTKAISECGVSDTDRRYNLTWMDRLNLENLTLVSRAIAAAADARTDSRGAHFRSEHPQSSALEASSYTVVRMQGEEIAVASEPVVFSRVSPGDTLIGSAA